MYTLFLPLQCTVCTVSYLYVQLFGVDRELIMFQGTEYAEVPNSVMVPATRDP